MDRTYLVIDLKSFFASVECVKRGLDPMTTDLVVADPERTDKTICLAVSVALKKKGVRNRCRVFEIPKDLDYIMAEPHMQDYIDYAARIYSIYLHYISQDDIHVYSIDEAFLDVTAYLSRYQMSARDFALFLMGKIREELGLRATCGIGSNLYLAKIALDITAKNAPDFVGELTEESFKKTLWQHRPLADFWRTGARTEKTLNKMGIFTMEDLAHADEDLLYDTFGVDAELIIDHAWGREPCTIADIKNYVPKSSSLSSGQVLSRAYSKDEARIIAREMAEDMILKVLREGFELSGGAIMLRLDGGGGVNRSFSFTEKEQKESLLKLYPRHILEAFEEIMQADMRIRGLNLVCVLKMQKDPGEQLSVFDLPEIEDANADERRRDRDRRLGEAILEIRGRFGDNALLKAGDLDEAATARERHTQIGGHKA